MQTEHINDSKVEQSIELSKYDYITELGKFLSDHDKVMSFSALARHLNQNGFKTSWGTYYVDTVRGGRGIAKLITAVYNRLDVKGKPEEARKVAKSFVTESGKFAYS